MLPRFALVCAALAVMAEGAFRGGQPKLAVDAHAREILDASQEALNTAEVAQDHLTLADKSRALLSRVRVRVLGFVHHTAEPDEKEVEDMSMQEVGLFSATEMIFSFFLLALFYGGAAYYYHEHVYFAPVEKWGGQQGKASATEKDALKEWKYGLFDCPGQELDGDTEMFLWSCCCPGIRWADSVSKMGVGILGAEAGHDSFWRAFWCMTAFYFLFYLPIAGSFVSICMAIFAAHYRQQMRSRFEFPEEQQGKVMMDCLSYLCCLPCTIAQDARQVRSACIVGHPCIVLHDKEVK